MSLSPPPDEALGSFTPFTFDASNLHHFLTGVLRKVESCERENERLNAELFNLKIAARLDMLEQSVQELADLAQPGKGYGMPPASQTPPQREQPPAAACWFPEESWSGSRRTTEEQRVEAPVEPAVAQPEPLGVLASAWQQLDAATVQHGAYVPAAAAATAAGSRRAQPSAAQWEGSSCMHEELQSVKERVLQMERKAEALWHVKESDEGVRGEVQRLKLDVGALNSAAGELQGSALSTTGLVGQLESGVAQAQHGLKEVLGQMEAVKGQLAKASEEREGISAKLGSSIQRIWDDIRLLDGSTSERLAQAEATDASFVQQLELRGEQTEAVRERVEDMHRHVVALENKLESFNSQVAAALSPLHSSLGDVKQHMEELSQQKQDIAAAVTLNDVNLAGARAMDHADRRADNLIKSIGGLETRVEALNTAKANKCDVVMTTDLQSLLTAHASELDQHLDALKDEILRTVGTKAEKEALADLDTKLGPRISGLESAILKGIKAVSDKVTIALTDKLDLASFVDFQSHVRVVLLDLEQRLKDWSPLARGLKSSLDDSSSGSVGGAAVSCLCCDSKVRSHRDLQGMGFSSSDKVFTPERLPNVAGLLPSIQRSPDVAAHSSAHLVKTRRSLMTLLTKETPSSTGLPESLPEHSGIVDRVLTGSTSLGSFDSAALLGVDIKSRLSKGSSGPMIRVGVETITAAAASSTSSRHSNKDLALLHLSPQRSVP